MAIRERLKRTFRSKKSGSSDGDGYPPRRKDIEYYKPHEIPKSKYKGKVDPGHKERLEAYDLGDAFESTQRKTSLALSGTFSPGGTQAMSAAQSRRSSWTSRDASSTGTTSSNATSATSAGSIDDQITSVASSGMSKEAKLEEGDENDSRRIDDELSRAVTSTDQLSTADDQDVAKLWVEKTITQGKTSSNPHNTPFLMEELEAAMTRNTLRPRRGTVIGHLEEVVVPQA